MNTRSFIKSLALIAGAASVSPSIFLPKFEPVRWKRVLVPNPEWVKAEYEFALLTCLDEFKNVILFKREETNGIIRSVPLLTVDQAEDVLGEGWELKWKHNQKSPLTAEPLA